MVLKYRVISGTIWNAINSSATFIISIGTIAILARLLRPEDFGIFAMITVVMNILDSFSDMGVSAAVISYRDVQDHELASLFYFNIAVGIALTILLILVSPVVVFYYKEPKIYLYLWILSLNFTITSPAVLFHVLLKKEMQFKILSKINIVSSLVYSVSAIAYAFFTRSIMSLVIAVLLQSLTSTLLIIRFGSRIWKPSGFLIKYSYLKRFLSFGLYQMGERIINRLNWNIDYLIIGPILGAQALGYYYMAYNLMRKPLQKINPIITTVAFPALSEIQEDTAQLKRYFLKMIRYIIYMLGPIYIALFILSEQVILFLYGDRWLLSVPVLAIFSFLGILYALGNPMGNLILAKGRADIGFWLNAGQTLFLLAANYIGVRWGIIGVAFSTLFVTLFLFFPAGFFVRHYLVKMTAGEYLDQIKKPLLFAMTAAGMVLMLQSYLNALMTLSVIQQLILYGMAFMIIYMVLLVVFDKEEIAFIRKTIADYIAKRKDRCAE
jgi:O-antigen/teichoic acid export membrane protein